jgi:broad specificity phosphatase PhoE
MGQILLIRHGQASFGAGDYDRLSKTGVEQAGILGQRLREATPAPDRILCGDMRRHRQTAEGALAAMGLPAEWETERGWNEYDHVAVLSAHKPRWANQALMKAEMAATLNPRKAFQAEFSKAMARWVCGKYDGDYPESWPAFSERVLAAMKALHESLGKSQTALVFTSGGTITAVAHKLLQLDTEHAFRLNWTLANAAITKLIYSERGLYLSSLNDHAHFEGARSNLITYR